MKNRKKCELGLTLIEVIISLLILSSITLITIISVRSYSRNYNKLEYIDQYYSEKLRVSVAFNQLLKYNDQSVFSFEFINNSFKVYDEDKVILEYNDDTLYNYNEYTRVKLKIIKNIKINFDNEYLIIELIADNLKENLRIRWY